MLCVPRPSREIFNLQCTKADEKIFSLLERSRYIEKVFSTQLGHKCIYRRLVGRQLRVSETRLTKVTSESNHNKVFRLFLCPLHCTTTFHRCRSCIASSSPTWRVRQIKGFLKILCKNVHLNKGCSKLFSSSLLVNNQKKMSKLLERRPNHRVRGLLINKSICCGIH